MTACARRTCRQRWRGRRDRLVARCRLASLVIGIAAGKPHRRGRLLRASEARRCRRQSCPCSSGAFATEQSSRWCRSRREFLLRLGCGQCCWASAAATAPDAPFPSPGAIPDWSALSRGPPHSAAPVAAARTPSPRRATSSTAARGANGMAHFGIGQRGAGRASPGVRQVAAFLHRRACRRGDRHAPQAARGRLSIHCVPEMNSSSAGPGCTSARRTAKIGSFLLTARSTSRATKAEVFEALREHRHEASRALAMPLMISSP